MKKQSSSNKLEPALRFPQFTDPWEQRKLESLCEVFTDGDWIEAKDQNDSGIRLVQTGNVGTTEYLDKPNNKKWISEDTFESLHCKEIFEGDILISRLPEPAGRACIMPDLGTRMITAVDCTIVRTLAEYDSKYLVQYLSTPMYFNVVKSFLGGGTRQRISRGNLSGINIPIPPSFDEQKRIGYFLTSLDNTITLHQRKLDVFKKYKRGLLQEIFKKITTNEILIDDVVDEYCEKTSKNNEYPILSSTMSGITLQNEYFGKQTASQNTIGYKIVPYGFMTYRSMSDTGLFRFNLQKIVENGIVSPAYPVFKIKDEYNAVFIEYLLNETNYVKKQIRVLKEGGTRFALSFSKFRNLTINLPSKKDQDHIASLINYFDNLIAQEELKLNYFRIYKQGLLRKMFI